ncbi:MAG: S8 family serine peptidase [Deltaproteobacteria bacterium]|nr:S8 family serine peptidase [Deltaproteobacteria bacterium]
MKKLAVLLGFLLTFQSFTLVVIRTGSASSELPFGTCGIIPADRVPSSFPAPNIEKKVRQWQFYNPKLDSKLNCKLEKTLLDNLDEMDSAAASDIGKAGIIPEAVCVQVVSAAENQPAVEKDIARLHGTVTGHNASQTVIQALVPSTSLNALANLKKVNFVRTPERAVTFAGSYSSEALTDINAANWHNAGIYGQNVRIGIADVGFSGYKALLGNDLPASVTARNFVDGETSAQIDSGSPHGTACAEIIHDVAPEAAIYLAKIYSDIDLAEAVTWLHDTCNVDIISTSLGWYNLTPGDGTGDLADIVSNAYAAGIFWTTAAGNDRLHHWGGDFYDPDNDGILNFYSDQTVNYFGPGDGSAYLVDSGVTLNIYARWSDWQNVDQDYDLYVYRAVEGSTWERIASSLNFQNGTPGQTPTEAVEFTTYGSPAAYGFIVYRASEATKAVNFEIFVPYAPRLDKITPSRSLPNLADVPRATTVSAVDAHSFLIYEDSSEGPTNGPGGIATGGIGKPDIAAYTNVTTASFGPQGFSGSSAATPHVAGAAALILCNNPEFTPAQLQSSLTAQAIDIEAPGFDYATGWGRLCLNSLPIPDGSTTWIGYSTDWNSSGNWSSSIPDNNTTVLIPPAPAGGYWPEIFYTQAHAAMLTLAGRLTVTSSSIIIGP